MPIAIFKGPKDSEHTHPPDVDENSATKLAASLKRKAEEHPEQPPSQLLRTELQGVPDEVLSHLPSQPALVSAMQRVRRRKMPANPIKLSALGDIPEKYKKTLLGEQFLLHDSGPPPVNHLPRTPMTRRKKMFVQKDRESSFFQLAKL